MAEQGTPRTGVPPQSGGAGMMERLLVAGTSACIADALTFPLDTAKVRLQVSTAGRPTVSARVEIAANRSAGPKVLHKVDVGSYLR